MLLNRQQCLSGGFPKKALASGPLSRCTIRGLFLCLPLIWPTPAILPQFRLAVHPPKQGIPYIGSIESIGFIEFDSFPSSTLICLAMDEKQYLKMRAKAEEEYKKNLEAIDRVWHMSHPDKAPPADPKRPTQAVERLAERGFLAVPVIANGFIVSVAVKEAIRQLPENAEVTQPMILRHILDRYPDVKPRIEKDQIKAQIAGVLSRMTKSGQLIRLRPSHGSEPSVFKKLFRADIDDTARARPHG